MRITMNNTKSSQRLVSWNMQVEFEEGKKIILKLEKDW